MCDFGVLLEDANICDNINDLLSLNDLEQDTKEVLVWRAGLLENIDKCINICLTHHNHFGSNFKKNLKN